MGLDITAYSNLEPVGKHAETWCENEHHVEAYAYDSFPQSFRGFSVLGREGDFVYGGCYAVTDETLTHCFRAGSYSGYNLWRSDLQAQFNPDRNPDKPFYELIWFADNEGTIGPDAARDLRIDFETHEGSYAAACGGDWGLDEYRAWKRACELAANNGLIDFH